MSLLRNRDALVALGLGLAIVVGVKVTIWQIQQGEKLAQEKVQVKIQELEKKVLEARAKVRDAVDDDISLDHLETLVRHPNYDIRHAAIKILLYRVEADPYCREALQKDHRTFAERSRQEEYAGEYDEAYGLYMLASNYGIRLPLRTYSDSEFSEYGRPTGVERDDDVLSVRGALNMMSTSHLELDRFLRGDNREVLGRFQEHLPEDNTEQSPEEVALTQWRRREAVVIESEHDNGQVEVIMPAQPFQFATHNREAREAQDAHSDTGIMEESA